ncbi:MAG: secretin N-terminal domain-containing protein [Candidatus Kaelpia aquatica]|nr:secretin N-terminal domain-containing protein [Candidatus Kaelpia aquatica]
MKFYRNIVLIFAILIMVSSSLFAQEKIDSLGKTISLDFKDASLKDILKVFSMQSGLNFVASDRIEDKKLTLYMENVPVDKALDTILKANSLTYFQPPDSNIFVVKKLNVPAVETMTRIYRLNYADPAEIKGLFEGMSVAGQVQETTAEGNVVTSSFLQGILSEYGKIASDKRTNSLIVTDIPSRFPMIEDAITQLDQPTPQVMIEAEILEVSTDYMEEIGIYFEDSGMIQITGSELATRFPFNTKGRFSGLTDSTSGYGTISAVGFDPLLNLLKQNQKTKVLARPKILTLSNQTAEIKITADTAIGTSTTDTDSSDYTEAERMETGVKLIVTPIVNKDSFVTIDIVSEVVDPKQSAFFDDYVDPHTRSAKATIRIKDGDTLIMGGLIKRDEDMTVRKVPFFGDIPIIGKVFRHTYKLNESKELIIFITPHIIKDSYYSMTQASDSIEREFSVDNSASKEEVVEQTLQEFN